MPAYFQTSLRDEEARRDVPLQLRTGRGTGFRDPSTPLHCASLRSAPLRVTGLKDEEELEGIPKSILKVHQCLYNHVGYKSRPVGTAEKGGVASLREIPPF